jgi:hypothetical protein
LTQTLTTGEGSFDLLTPKQLSDRYYGTPTVRTITNWRHMNYGPRYIKIGKSVFYRLIDVENWENRQSGD